MKDDRLKVPADTHYLAAIAMATCCFVTMEWNCSEKLSSGYINKIADKTAGTIAKDVVGFAALINDPVKRVRYKSAVVEFRSLVKRRNDLLHSNPATVGNDQRLVRHVAPWQPGEIDDLADEFAACSNDMNDLFNHVL